MAIKCQHEHHDDSGKQSKKSLMDEEKPKEHLIGVDAQEKHELKHVKNDWFEQGNDLLTLHVYIKELKTDNLDIALSEDELNVQFSTRDRKFLDIYQETTEETLFNWNVKLREKIDVPKCTFKILKYMIEINLKKKTPGRWGSFQQPNLSGLLPSRTTITKEFTQIHPDSPSEVPVHNTNGEVKNNTSSDNNHLSMEIESTDKACSVNGVLEQDSGLLNNCNGVMDDSNYTKQIPKVPDPPPIPLPPLSMGAGVVGGSSTYSNKGSFSDAIQAAANMRDGSHVVDTADKQEEYSIKKGFTGLENLGNTCYLNSIIQCLANTRSLRDFFLSGEYKEDLNAGNPLSFGGKLALVFANLLKHLWSGKARHIAPQQLKVLVGEKICQFKGFMQQDAQEFMAFLLDGLHEDLNRIIHKPYTEDVEGAGRADHQVADKAWERYKSRNHSIIVDLFQGQLKSKLTCPVCNTISIKFDPFINLSVPLPKEQKLLNVIVFFKDPSRTSMKVKVKVSQDANLEQLTTAIQRKTQIREDNMRVFEEFQGKFHKFFEKGGSLSNVVSSDNIYVCEVLGIEEAGEEVYEVPIIQKLLYPLTIPLHCADCYKNQDPNDPLKRCVGCYAIGYCNKTCQEKHWPMHKKQCKKGGKHAIGVPFIVSMPASQATYTRLNDLAHKYTKHSVEVRNGETANQPVNQPLESLCPASTSQFVFEQVNLYGESVIGTGARLTDQGDQPLDLSNKILGLDWKNIPNARNWVNVKNKIMECDEDPSCTSEEPSTSYSCSLKECLELFTEPETLGKDDAWYCPKCKVHREATKQLSVWRMPEILIIHLKRFSFRNILYKHKITKLVEFPLRGLDMSSFTADKGRVCNDLYDLYAVSNHMGTVNFGHYTAYGRIPEKHHTLDDKIGWRYFDDRSVTPSSEERVVSKCAYVLFYQRRRQRSETPRKPFVPSQETTTACCESAQPEGLHNGHNSCNGEHSSPSRNEGGTSSVRTNGTASRTSTAGQSEEKVIKTRNCSNTINQADVDECELD